MSKIPKLTLVTIVHVTITMRKVPAFRVIDVRTNLLVPIAE
jgi:hypothetical protein